MRFTIEAIWKTPRPLMPLPMAFVLCFTMFRAAPVQATFVGDLVFCDVDGNGLFEPAKGDYGLNGAGVRIVCETADHIKCVDFSTVTGEIHPSAAGQLGFFLTLCADALNWDPFTDLTGRYLFEVYDSCAPAGPRPWTCAVTLDPGTLPPNCGALDTPLAAGPPTDGNIDGDFCDAEDGPFPERQPLGNLGPSSTCADYPDPAPSDGSFTVIVDPKGQDGCAIYNDFGAAPVCGDNSVNRPEEQCDGTDDAACPGLCQPPGEELECQCCGSLICGFHSPRITVGRPGGDRLRLASLLFLEGTTIDPPSEPVTLTLADADGAFYSATVPPGNFREVRRGWLFKDPSGTIANGLQRVRINRGHGKYRLKAVGRGVDLTGADRQTISTTVIIGNTCFKTTDVWTVRGFVRECAAPAAPTTTSTTTTTTTTLG